MRCVCGQTDYSGPPFGPGLGKKSAQRLLHLPTPYNVETLRETSNLFIQCDTCQAWQHGGCVGIFSNAAAPDEYFCELCRSDRHMLSTNPNG